MTRSAVISGVLLLAGCAALCSYLVAFASRRLAFRAGAIDQPTGGRKIHHKPIPLWGGLGIAVTIVCLSILVRSFSFFDAFGPIPIPVSHLVGYIAGLVVLGIGGAVDDRYPLAAKIQIIFPILAILAVMSGGVAITQVSRLTGHGALSLVWWSPSWNLFGFSLDLLLPAHLITFVWLLVATYATKVLDGLDGLVTGQTVIGAALVGTLTLTTAYFQPGVSVLAAVVGGAFLGFLPHNINPAKQFLGEAGATMAGFSLGVLALLSSAKIAIALSVLAIPIADVFFVFLGRLYRGEPWYRGDMTHLHFRLLRAGFSQQAAVWTLWLVSLFAGIAALGLQTRGKIFLVTSLVIGTALASQVTRWFAHKAEDAD